MCMTQAGGFMPAKDIGIDLGTRNSLVFSTGKGIVLREPSVVVYDKDTEKIRAIGEEARQMASHLTSNMEVIWPIRRGVIVDYNVMEKMLKYFISQAMGRRAFRKPRVSISVPSGITEIERKAVEEAAYQSGAREVFLVDEPIAAAIGAGVDITKPFGNLIVDIGAGTTDVAVVSVGGVVVSASVKVAGDNFDHAIMNYVREKHSLFIGEDAAENIKIKIGTASEEADLRTMEVKGRNLVDGLPKNIEITAADVREALADQIYQVVDAIRTTFEKTPPELAADIIDKGIVLTGGGARLRNIDKLITAETGMSVRVAPDPLDCVALGLGKRIETNLTFDTYVFKRGKRYR